MALVMGLALIIAAAAAIGAFVAHRSHSAAGYDDRAHQELPIIGSSYPAGLD